MHPPRKLGTKLDEKGFINVALGIENTFGESVSGEHFIPHVNQHFSHIA